jgi:hypothetical protein
VVDDADEEEKESFRWSESQGKRVEVYVDGEMRGLIIIYPRKTFLSVRNQIYRVAYHENYPPIHTYIYIYI